MTVKNKQKLTLLVAMIMVVGDYFQPMTYDARRFIVTNDRVSVRGIADRNEHPVNAIF